MQDVDALDCHNENTEGGGEGENQRAGAGQRDGSCYGPGHEQGFSDDGDEENGQGDVFGLARVTFLDFLNSYFNNLLMISSNLS